MKEKVLKFIANNPLGSAVKVGLGSALVYILNNVSDLKLSPAVTIIVIALVNVAINWVNPQDHRYGYAVAGE
jgi:hypothetical protein